MVHERAQHLKYVYRLSSYQNMYHDAGMYQREVGGVLPIAIFLQLKEEA